MNIQVIVIDDQEANVTPILQALGEAILKRYPQFHLTVCRDVCDTVAAAAEILRSDTRADLVFLDYIGVADTPHRLSTAIDELRAIDQYRPIVVLSENRDSTTVLSSLDAGASYFIWKNDVALSAALSAQDEARREGKLDRITRRLVELVQDYRPVKRLLYAPTEVGVIEKTGNLSSSIIADQVEFLRSIKDIAPLQEHFPLVKEWGESLDGKSLSYEMPLYRYVSLRSYLLTVSEFDDDDHMETVYQNTFKAVASVLTFMFDTVYVRERERADPAYTDRWLTGKFARRLLDARKFIESELGRADGDKRIPLEGLRALLASDAVRVGEQLYDSPWVVIDRLMADPVFVAEIAEPELSMTHGDLHLDNILVDPSFLLPERFMLIDPRGAERGRGLLDKAYDFGKLLHSCHGLYDLIHHGALRCVRGVAPERDGHRSVGKIDWVQSIPRPKRGGGSGDDIHVYERGRKTKVAKLLARLERDIIARIAAEPTMEADATWKTRAYLNEALHFCTMLPFHLPDDVGLSMTIYVRGVELLNAFERNYRAGAFRLPVVAV